jgi:hypothetical protein
MGDLLRRSPFLFEDFKMALTVPLGIRITNLDSPQKNITVVAGGLAPPGQFAVFVGANASLAKHQTIVGSLLRLARYIKENWTPGEGTYFYMPIGGGTITNAASTGATADDVQIGFSTTEQLKCFTNLQKYTEVAIDYFLQNTKDN